MLNSCVNFNRNSFWAVPSPSGCIPPLVPRYIQTKMAEYAEELWELMQVRRDAREDVFSPLKVADSCHRGHVEMFKMIV